MSNSSAATPVINPNDQQMNFQEAAAQPAALRRRGAINLGRIQQNPNGTIAQPNIAAAARQANANAARGRANAPAEAAASTNTNNKMNTTQGGKRKRKTLRKTRRNKNKRTRKH